MQWIGRKLAVVVGVLTAAALLGVHAEDAEAKWEVRYSGGELEVKVNHTGQDWTEAEREAFETALPSYEWRILGVVYEDEYTIECDTGGASCLEGRRPQPPIS